MYIPKHFHCSAQIRLHRFIHSHPFATVVTVGKEGSLASHLPLLITEEEGPHGTLFGHMARANPQWQSFTPNTKILIIFHGPHSYVSPAWYVNKNNVPTWNYVAVHAHGIGELVQDPKDLVNILRLTTKKFEQEYQSNWNYSAPDNYKNGLMNSLIGFRIKINKLEGKVKMGQNNKSEDSAGAIKGLRKTNQPSSLAVADLMEEFQSSKVKSTSSNF